MKRNMFKAIAVITLCASLLLGACSKESSTSSTDGKKEFRYAMSGVYKPFSYKENSKLAGFDVEIGEALAKKMNMKAVPVTNPWETLIQGLQAKKYDVILGSMAITSKSSELYEPILSFWGTNFRYKNEHLHILR